MKQYLKLLEDIKQHGTPKGPARENMPGTLSLFGYRIEHDLAEGFPLLTTKKLSFKNIATELCWILRGDANIKYLLDHNCNIWNQDAYQYYVKEFKKVSTTQNPLSFAQFIECIKAGATTDVLYEVEKVKNGKSYMHYNLGDCGYLYGEQIRNWNKRTDQLEDLVKGLKTSPLSRRHILTVLDPEKAGITALYWCNVLTQFNCREIPYENRRNMTKNYLQVASLPNCTEGFMLGLGIPQYYIDCQFYARSSDAFLGCPYDLASHALLTHIIAKMVNMVPGKISQSFGDVHIYDNHIDQVNEQLQRKPLPLPKLIIHTELLSFDVIKPEFFTVVDYEAWASIKAPLSTGLI